MITTAVFFGALFFLKEIPANPKCSVSVFQNKSVAYIISEPTGPGCLPEWTSANTVLVDEKGNIYRPVVLHAEPQRILTIDCQHNVTYHTECLELRVSLVVKCDYKCPNAPVVAKDTTMVKLPYAGRTHVVTFAVSGISLLLGFVIVIIRIYKYRLELESMNHDLA